MRISKHGSDVSPPTISRVNRDLLSFFLDAAVPAGPPAPAALTAPESDPWSPSNAAPAAFGKGLVFCNRDMGFSFKADAVVLSHEILKVKQSECTQPAPVSLCQGFVGLVVGILVICSLMNS